MGIVDDRITAESVIAQSIRTAKKKIVLDAKSAVEKIVKKANEKSEGT